jgi:DNA repair protein RadC
MSIRLWPEQERPRERLLHHGPAVLSDTELLAIFLRTGTAQASAIDMARQLIDQFGSLPELLSAPAEQVLRHHGMGQAKYAHLMAAAELGRRQLEFQLRQGQALNDPALVKQYLLRQLGHEKREVFAVLFLDSQLRLLAFERLFLGSVTACRVYLREILSRALAHHAVQLIISHNHPDAPPRPSAADLSLTRQLREAAQLLDLQLVDHVIVGEGRALSLAETGQMP